MRPILLAAAAMFAVAAPHAAQAQELDDATEAATLAERLSDPAEQDRMAKMLDAIGEVLLEMPVGPIMDAAAQIPGMETPRVDRNTRMRDVAGPDAERLPGEIAERVPQMMGMMAGMIESFDAMRPLIEAMAGSMREAVDTQADY